MDITILHNNPIVDDYGNFYGEMPPNNSDLAEKVNELIIRINELTKKLDKIEKSPTHKE